MPRIAAAPNATSSTHARDADKQPDDGYQSILEQHRER
jgi:hypothetical protein